MCSTSSRLPALTSIFEGRKRAHSSLIPTENVQWQIVPSSSAFPESEAGRLLQRPFRGLPSVHLRYGLHTCQVAYAPFCTGGFSSFVASPAVLIASGWSEPVPGWGFHPLWITAFSRRTVISGLSPLITPQTKLRKGILQIGPNGHSCFVRMSAKRAAMAGQAK